MMRRTTIVVMALILSGCTTLPSSVWRHPVTGHEVLCTQSGRVGENSMEWGAYAGCKDEMADRGYVRVRKPLDQQTPPILLEE